MSDEKLFSLVSAVICTVHPKVSEVELTSDTGGTLEINTVDEYNSVTFYSVNKSHLLVESYLEVHNVSATMYTRQLRFVVDVMTKLKK